MNFAEQEVHAKEIRESFSYILWKKGTLIHCRGEFTVVELGSLYGHDLKKLAVELPYDPAIPRQNAALWDIPKGPNTRQESHPHSSVHRSTVTIARVWKQPECPGTDDCREKLWHVHTGSTT